LCSRSPFPKCVMCSPTCSGLRLTVPHCCLAGHGGDAATRVVPASSTRNAVCRQGNRAGHASHCLLSDLSRLLVVEGERAGSLPVPVVPGISLEVSLLSLYVCFLFPSFHL